MSRAIVQYVDLGICAVGCRAHVIPFDHPKSQFNGRWVFTSLVEAIEPGKYGPTFTTLNTIYKPLPPEEAEPVEYSNILAELGYRAPYVREALCVI